MGENLLGSAVRIIIYSLLVIFLVLSALLWYNASTLNTYMGQTSEIIARSGGLTHTAYQKCNELSARHYHGMFHISTNPNASRPTFNHDDLGEVIHDSGNVNDPNDNKGFGPNDSSNYESHEYSLGHVTKNYVYVDIPYNPPFAQNLAYHSGQFYNNQPIAENVRSSIRAGSQF